MLNAVSRLRNDRSASRNPLSPKASPRRESSIACLTPRLTVFFDEKSSLPARKATEINGSSISNSAKQSAKPSTTRSATDAQNSIQLPKTDP